MRRSALWIVILVFSALPLAAEPQPVPACGGPAAGSFSVAGLVEAPALSALPKVDLRAAKPVPELLRFEYLPYCWMCESQMPCDTECGWDPGKGGPVTCGEYGAPCGG